jgi:hypothetical protein
LVGVALGVSLIAYGNRWFATEEVDEVALSDIALRHVRRLRFLVGGDNLVLLAESPRLWYQSLERLGCGQLRLSLDPRPRDLETVVLHGVGAAPLWAPFSIGAEREMVWHVSERRIAGEGYDFDLLGVPCSSDIRPPEGNLEGARSELAAALAEASDLALERGEDDWADRFVRATAALEDPLALTEEGNRGLLPVGYGSVEQRQLLAASAWAYVFGEGGWCEWEGNPTPGRQELARVALNLYVATVEAIQAAVNT